MRKIVAFALCICFPLSASCQEKSANSPVLQSSTAWSKVVNVSDDDALNMRSDASSKSNIVFSLPYDAHNIMILDTKGAWSKVHYRGHSGWVSSKYIQTSEPSTAQSTFKGELFCLGTEPHWNLATEANKASLSILGEQQELYVSGEFRNSNNRTDVWLMSLSSPTKKHSLTLGVLQQQSCSDGMSDTDYPFSLHLMGVHAGSLMSGCCKTR
ncbi:SH3 domain-containing protein [Alteromonadaceae bacterium Bs31]|nr:SH3 domain-containing protein [Alteromonadaceae bacterium Bs31]